MLVKEAPEARICCARFRIAEEGKVRFYSHTTAFETYPIDLFYRIWINGFFSNPLFPYTVNIQWEAKDGKCDHTCLGISKEFGEWLLANLKWDKITLAKEAGVNDDVDTDDPAYNPEQPIRWERNTKHHSIKEED